MRSHISRLLVVLVSCSLYSVGARAAGDVQLSEVAIRTLAPRTILYREVETSLSEMGQTVGPILEQLEALAKEKKVVFDGAAVFVYFGATGEPDKKFKLQVSFAVAEDTEPQGEFKVRKLEPFKCATVLYGGPMTSIPKAYEKVYGGLGNNTPTGESREYYFNWEGVESDNNVELIAVGIK
jgi:effector-binding domain-containing protein